MIAVLAATGCETESEEPVVGNGVLATVCASGEITGYVVMESHLTVQCGGDASGVDTDATGTVTE